MTTGRIRNQAFWLTGLMFASWHPRSSLALSQQVCAGEHREPAVASPRQMGTNLLGAQPRSHHAAVPRGAGQPEIGADVLHRMHVAARAGCARRRAPGIPAAHPAAAAPAGARPAVPCAWSPQRRHRQEVHARRADEVADEGVARALEQRIGVPTCTTRPRVITTTWSAKVSASTWSCVT